MTGEVKPIPMLDLEPQIEAKRDDLLSAVDQVLRSGRFILGPQVAALEHEVASYLGVKHAIGVNSGTDALVISLRALGIGPGDEVITTPFTFFATPESISNVGARPVFVDIERSSYNMDATCIEPVITERTKAILPVHLFGHAAAMDRIMDIARRYELKVIEDVAQALGGSYGGRKLGSIGHVSALSFFPSKNLGGFGDGGMVVTDDDEVARLSRMLRTHGSSEPYRNELLGFNSRLDEIHAALLRIGLPDLEMRNQARRLAAERYREQLADLPFLTLPSEATSVSHVYHQFTVRVQDGTRVQLRERLAAAGVETRVYYPVPCHRFPVYSGGKQSLPVADSTSSEVLSLPMGPSITASDIEHIGEVLREDRLA